MKYNPQAAEALARMNNKEVNLWEVYCGHCKYGWSFDTSDNTKIWRCKYNISPETLDGEPCVYYEWRKLNE